MEILELKLTNFRNYPKLSLNFSPYKNIIIGNNGIGKTNIVEGIYSLALTKSFRTNADANLICKDCDYTIVEGTVKDKIVDNYKIIFETQKKRVYINNNQVRRLSDYISKINVINLSSEDIKLIKDSPSVHRQLMNIEISQFDNNYIKKLSIYNKILKQRNAYLKTLANSNKYDLEYLYIITHKLIEYGIEIYNYRKDFIDKINEHLNKYFKKITGKETLTLKYVSDFEGKEKEQIFEKYKRNNKSDINYGNTSYGIHLDDFVFYFNDIPAKNYLSEGEQKNAIISFKLSEIDVFYKLKSTMPIFILDDLFSDLDNQKVKKILKLLKKNIQIFITTTDLNNLSKDNLSGSKVFEIKNDKIKERYYE